MINKTTHTDNLLGEIDDTAKLLDRQNNNWWRMIPGMAEKNIPSTRRRQARENGWTGLKRSRERSLAEGKKMAPTRYTHFARYTTDAR